MRMSLRPAGQDRIVVAASTSDVITVALPSRCFQNPRSLSLRLERWCHCRRIGLAKDVGRFGWVCRAMYVHTCALLFDLEINRQVSRRRMQGRVRRLPSSQEVRA